MKKLLIILGLFFLFKIPYSFCCSCSEIFYCDYLADLNEERVFIKGKVLNHIEYSDQNIAVYIEVLDKFRDDRGITDTIKLFGSSLEAEAGCKVYAYKFKEGSEIYLGLGLTHLGNPIGFDVVDPDLEQDRYWSYGIKLCSMIKLEIKNEVVRGRISENDRIFEYPQEFFELRLELCDFSEKELNKYRCSLDNFIVFPNPSKGEEINIRNNYNYSSISQVNIYSVDGKLKNQLDYPIEPFQRIKLKMEESGVYVIEIICEEQIYYKKVVVKK